MTPRIRRCRCSRVSLSFQLRSPYRSNKSALTDMSAHDAVVTSPISSSIPQHLSTRSPRSSIDSSPRTPTSPFLTNLSQRFRKSSNASNLSQGPDLASQPAESAETAQSARRFVLGIVRNDWEWPPPSGEENEKVMEAEQENVLTQREPVGWKTRHEGASDLDLDASPITSGKKSKRSSDPYKFESPDTIANVIQEQRLKMRRANLEETAWNEGLRIWSERRDAWTAAQPEKPRKRSSAEMHGHRHTFSPTRSQHKTSRSSDDSKSQEAPASNVNGTSRRASRRVSLAVESSHSNEDDQSDDLYGPYLPVYPPLFPTSHTLRARIKPAAYPTIYSKVVVQSLTPNVPIPLTHMVGALVDGWKAEGNWPPQTLAEQHQHALLKRAKGNKKGESAFQKWRRERDAERKVEDPMWEDGFADELIDHEDEKKGFRRSISGAVKKVLGIHPEVEEDGGLAKLGLKFGIGGSSDEEGLMKESLRIAEDNVVLNKGLLDQEKD